AEAGDGRYALDAEAIPDERTGTAEQELLAAERHAALREALLELPPCGQRLILLLIEDPPVPYAEISARLGIPVGSIGPTRGRCLDKLRCHPAIAALTDPGSRSLLPSTVTPSLIHRTDNLHASGIGNPPSSARK